MKISVIGAGYVGLTTAACLAELGHQVFCSENDLQKLAKLQNGELPFFEPFLEPIVQKSRNTGRLQFGSTEDAIGYGQCIFICVGTPPLDNGDADLSAIERVARTIAKRGQGYRLVIEKSTVPVQTAVQLRRHLGQAPRHVGRRHHHLLGRRQQVQGLPGHLMLKKGIFIATAGLYQQQD